MLSAGVGHRIRENSILIESLPKQALRPKFIHQSWQNSVWIKYQSKNLYYKQMQDRTFDELNTKINPNHHIKNTFIFKLNGQRACVMSHMFFFSQEKCCMQAWIDLSGILPTPSSGINLNTEINNSDTLFPFSTLWFEIRHWTASKMAQHHKVTLSWSQILRLSITNCSLFSTAQCDTLFWCIPSVLHNILLKRWWPINQLTSGARLQIKTCHPLQAA